MPEISEKENVKPSSATDEVRKRRFIIEIFHN